MIGKSYKAAQGHFKGGGYALYLDHSDGLLV